ncbi:ATP-binding protein [Streptomyces sp. NPDC059862]|uniref:ATP-binding protein n=1 Tax=unclassified Streptomyces TaxID=2593676 RepID=UPI00363B5FC5
MNDLDSTVGPASTRLVGRDRDLAFIHSFFGNSEVHGAALLLSGEAGVGKTAVLDAVPLWAQRLNSLWVTQLKRISEAAPKDGGA